MRHLLLTFLSACITLTACKGEDPVYIVNRKSSLCLGVGSDEATLQILTCGETDAEKWRLIPAPGAHSGYLMKNYKFDTCIDSEKSDNGGVAQAFPCKEDSPAHHISFNSDGKIVAGVKCLIPYKDGEVGDMLHFSHDCAAEWATTKHPTQASQDQGPPSLDEPTHTPKAPRLEPVKPAVQQTSSSSSSSSSSSQRPLVDHYLCICLDHEADDNECVEAVKSACVVGHIPADDCAASFDNGDHEAVSQHVLRLVKDGAHCTATTGQGSHVSKAKLKGLTGHTLPTSEDHYLCVCLKNGGMPTDEACLAAVSSACMVGHIPVTACALSFDKGDHSRVVNHIMRMIDNSAKCKATLDYQKMDVVADTGSKAVSNNPLSGADHYLCVCLDDWKSEACKDAVKRGCDAHHLPKDDCEVSWTGSFSNAVTKKVLHLIDHGVACSAHGAMHFTNHKCHCQQTWTSEDGVLMQYPNNCGDPRGKRGFAWCKTYETEGCHGTAKGWDRCDAPKHPMRDISRRKKGKAGHVTTADHYLCVCLDKDASDEVCLAATKSACAIGHLPSDACRESFENGDHEKVTKHILELVGDAGCKGSKRRPVAPSLKRHKHSQSSLLRCAHGSHDSNGECSCETGFSGKSCDQCAKGYEGYPDCTKKAHCRVHCVHGTCDEWTGKCDCPVNRVGESCEQCAPGLVGKECLPPGVVTSFDTFTTIKRIFVILVVIGGLTGGCWWYYVKPIRYPQKPDFFSKASNMEMTNEKSSSDPNSLKEQNPIFHTGLAI